MGHSRTPTSAFVFRGGFSTASLASYWTGQSCDSGGRPARRCSDTTKKRNVNDVPEMVEIVCSGFCDPGILNKSDVIFPVEGEG